LLIFLVSRGDVAMLEVSEAEIAALAEQSKMASAEGLTRILEVFGDAEMRLRDAASKKILIEVALLKAIEARSALSLDSVLKQLQGLREGNGREVVSIPMPVAASAPGPKPFRAEVSAMTPPETQAAQSSEGTEAHQLAPFSAPLEESAGKGRPLDGELAALWAKVVEDVGRVSPFTRT